MSLVLYCAAVQPQVPVGGEIPDGSNPPTIVIATHDSEQNVDPALYGPDVQPVTMIPWDQSITALERYGDPPQNMKDRRPYLAPTLTTADELTKYARFKQRYIFRNADSVAVMQAAGDVLAAVLDAIKGGKITTQAQVDKPPKPIQAWPAIAR